MAKVKPDYINWALTLQRHTGTGGISQTGDSKQGTP